jgi:hypothetical protein
MANQSVVSILGKRAHDFISPPPTGWRNLYEPDVSEYRSQLPQRWYGPGRIPRARSPTPEEQQEAAAIQRETLRIEEQKQGQIDNMIAQLNGVSGMALDNKNEILRYVVASVIKTHGAGRKTINLLRRSPIVLGILRDQLPNYRDVANFACAAGSKSAACVKEAAAFMSGVLSRGASSAKTHILRAVRPSDRRVVNQQALAGEAAYRQQVANDQLLAQQVANDQLLAQQVANDQLLAQHLSSNFGAQRAAFADFESAQKAVSARASAPPPPPPPPVSAPKEAVENICAICFLGEGIDEYGVDRGPLGYVAVHTPPLDSPGYIDTGHPDRFHEACLRSCPGNKCPMCRAKPVWGLVRKQRQGGGGSKKYRSKPRSKSKSKTRRLRKSRNKSRKSCKSRKPRSSSRRK